MKPFSLLQALQDAAPAAAIATTPLPEINYHVFVVESEGVETQIGVPLEKVAEFEAHFAANPADLADITQHLGNFGAIVI